MNGIIRTWASMATWMRGPLSDLCLMTSHINQPSGTTSRTSRALKNRDIRRNMNEKRTRPRRRKDEPRLRRTRRCHIDRNPLGGKEGSLICEMRRKRSADKAERRSRIKCRAITPLSVRRNPDAPEEIERKRLGRWGVSQPKDQKRKPMLSGLIDTVPTNKTTRKCVGNEKAVVGRGRG